MARLKVEGMAALLGEVQGASISEKSEGQKLVSIERLTTFASHPFRPYTEGKMAEMVESIREHGIMEPLVVRRAKDAHGCYEIIAGHNRCEGAKRAGLSSVPIIERDVDDETATIMMVNSNFVQRENILPSEKAFAFKMKLDAIKRKAGRPSSGNVGQVDPHSSERFSREIVASDAGESPKQISRYIRLTELIPELLQRVDDGKLKFIPAVDISFLTVREQELLVTALQSNGCDVSLQQASLLKERSKEQTLSSATISEIMAAPKAAEPKAIKLPFTKVRQFFQPGASSAEIEGTIVKALEKYYMESR